MTICASSQPTAFAASPAVGVPSSNCSIRASTAAAGAAEVRIAKAAEVLHATGFEPGGVAPFPQRAVVQSLMDRSFFAYDTVWIGAGTAAHMAEIGPAELQRLTRARTVDLAGHG